MRDKPSRLRLKTKTKIPDRTHRFLHLIRLFSVFSEKYKFDTKFGQKIRKRSGIRFKLFSTVFYISILYSVCNRIRNSVLTEFGPIFTNSQSPVSLLYNPAQLNNPKPSTPIPVFPYPFTPCNCGAAPARDRRESRRTCPLPSSVLPPFLAALPPAPSSADQTPLRQRRHPARRWRPLLERRASPRRRACVNF